MKHAEQVITDAIVQQFSDAPHCKVGMARAIINALKEEGYEIGVRNQPPTWPPAECYDRASCHRHGMCMYIQCQFQKAMKAQADFMRKRMGL